MHALKSLELKSAIITLKSLENNNLIVMGQDGTLRCLDTSSYKTLAGFKTNIKQERSWGNHMSVCASGKYAACVVPHSAKAAVYDVESKKLLYTTSGHKGDLESVCVDDNNHYIVTGGTDGKTNVHNLETKRLVYTFPPRADYITALDINSIWIVSSSYDKTISVLNLSTMQVPAQLKGHKAVVVQMKLLSNMRMISVDVEGNILLWNLKTLELLQRFKKVNDDVTCFSVSKDERFLFIGTKLGSVELYEIENAKLLKHNYIKEDTKICSLCVLDDKSQITVGTKSGKLSFYALIPNEEHLLERLKAKEYLGIYEEAKENPLLHYSPVYIQLELIWKNSFDKASKMLEANQKSNAEVILEPFKKVRSKTILIQNLFADYKEFKKFKTYVKEKKYFLAYPLVYQKPQFKNTSVYMDMENEWHVQFNKAKICILKKEGEEKVRMLLQDFKGISEKSVIIQELFKQRTAYMLFRKKLSQKDYLSIFALLKKCPFIKEFDEYSKLIDYADTTYIKAQKALDKKDYAKVVECTSILLNFPDLKDDANEMMANAKLMEKFIHAYEENDVASMYSMMGENPFLIELPEAQGLEDDWHHHLVLAEKFASKADLVNVVASLEDFFEIKAKHLPIALVVQQAYLSQLYRAIRSTKAVPVIKNAIKQYLVFFGQDGFVEEIVECFYKYHKEKFDISKLQKGDISLFKPFMIIPNIAV